MASAAARITVRIEFTDGMVREFEVEKPAQFDLTVNHPDWMLGGLPAEALDIVPPFRPVSLSFDVRAGLHPMTMRTNQVAEA